MPQQNFFSTPTNPFSCLPPRAKTLLPFQCPIGPVCLQSQKHKADTLDFNTVRLYASDEEDDTPSLTAEVATLLPPNTDTATCSQDVDETHVLLDNLAQALETPSQIGDEIHPKLAAIINSRSGKPLAPQKLKPILAKYGRP
eukprot:Seg4212.1 transcript_id=Seg4212.1/GoldUCD/mRNA.D3Y31 product="hypothetical protein" protein_id=Seg4212.1/GoldUCD/D3Y31